MEKIETLGYTTLAISWFAILGMMVI